MRYEQQKNAISTSYLKSKACGKYSESLIAEGKVSVHGVSVVDRMAVLKR